MPSYPEKASRATLLWLISLGIAIGLLLDLALRNVFFFAAERQDQTWLLYAAARLLDGTRLYGPRLVETNPPLIVWFSIVPAWLAIHLRLQPLFVLDLVVTLLLVLSSAWSVRILRAAGVLRGWAATLAAFVLLLVAQTPMRAIYFAEREHIFVLLLMPYLFASIFKRADFLRLAERLALGLSAGLGASIKPQYALIPIGTELFLALWYRQPRRLWRPELLVLIFTGVAYIAAVGYFTPLYFSQIVPLLRDTYAIFRGTRPVLWVMFHGVAYDLFFGATSLLLIVYRRSVRVFVAPIALLVASFFASIAFGIQQSGWPYQTVPRTSLLAVAVVWLAVELSAPYIARLQPDKHLRLLCAAAMVSVVLPASLLGVRRLVHGRDNGIPTLQERTYAGLPTGTTVYVFSTNFYDFSDVVHDHLRWGGRYVHLWMLPAIVRNEIAEAGGPPAAVTLPPARVQQLAALLRSDVAEDLHTFAPKVVFIEHCTPEKPCDALEGLSFDYLAWFKRSPAFASEWRNYHLQQSTEDWDVYTRNNLRP